MVAEPQVAETAAQEKVESVNQEDKVNAQPSLIDQILKSERR